MNCVKLYANSENGMNVIYVVVMMIEMYCMELSGCRYKSGICPHCSGNSAKNLFRKCITQNVF